ncbi:unnamed protein product [Sympodiomycopsis kandeliae]
MGGWRDKMSSIRDVGMIVSIHGNLIQPTLIHQQTINDVRGHSRVRRSFGGARWSGRTRAAGQAKATLVIEPSVGRAGIYCMNATPALSMERRARTKLS